MTGTRRKRTAANWGELGPAMRALPSDRWRAFVEHLVLQGSQADAARKAGFGSSRSRALTMAKIGYRLARDERIMAAVAEESRKVLRLGAPAAARALLNMVNNPEHKGHERAVMALVDRVDPTTTLQNISVTHRVIDPDQEALEEYRALLELGTPRAKLLELFGANGIERIEAMDLSRRAGEAKLIEAVPEVVDAAS